MSQISEFDYVLPEELIAQHPLERRDASRMLVVERGKRCWRDSSFSQFPFALAAGDVLVLNNTRVFPARLIGTRQPTGGKIEIFLIQPLPHRGEHVWRALAKPARRLDIGAQLTFGDGRLRGEVIESSTGEADRVVKFDAEGNFEQLLEEFGRMPLPPYIKRDGDDLAAAQDDRDRYQTIFAQNRGAIAAPTAGLHFTDRILDQITACGVAIAELTLHVGYGTFAPVRSEALDDHRVASERFEVSEVAARKINEARAAGGRVVAVGTTSVRALESASDESGHVEARLGETDLTITPGYRFRVVDGLLTNFHLPRSSLLVLVAAFASKDLILDAYRHAVATGYRFYSYGDCMLVI